MSLTPSPSWPRITSERKRSRNVCVVNGLVRGPTRHSSDSGCWPLVSGTQPTVRPELRLRRL